MSTNLIYNGNFSKLSITSNTTLFYTSFTTAQANTFYWTCAGSYVSVVNGTPPVNIPDPAIIGYSQYCYLYYFSSIQQSFTVPFPGSYILSFYYVARGGYSFNNMQILINGVVLTTISTSSSTWVLYRTTVSNVNIGINTIKFLGIVAGGAISLTGINFVYGQVGSAPPLIAATSNNFKSTNINGNLNVLDWIPSGGSLVPGTITTQQTYNYSYSQLPSITSSALGCVTTTNVAATTVGALSYTPSPSLTIPTGIYIVNAFCVFTPTTAATHTLQLGINTSNTLSGALPLYNNTIENTLVASALPHSIRYHNILTNTAQTTYYFVFYSNIAGNLNNSFNGKFIRIA